MSSDLASAAAPPAYTFRQLDPPAHTHAPGDLMSVAVAEAEAIREAARAAGHAEGLAAGIAAAQAETEAAVAAAHAAAASLDAARTEVMSALEADAVELGLRLAEQIVAGAIEVTPERLVDVAGLALRRLTDRRTVTLIVHPTDLELLSGATASLQGQLGGIEHLAVQADRRVARGGVIVRTDEGEIDATVQTQLERAREIAVAELSDSDVSSDVDADVEVA